ncbi:hypothetical protein, partial [Variovorax sp. JS1663]|uniref:hypothetical protein n=1 Tax=Variovorax sp. JS1663 TaxID=1851577 RepID=UPI00117D8C20
MESAEDPETRRSRSSRASRGAPPRPTTLWAAQELDPRQPAPQNDAQQVARSFSIKAEINQRSVDFLVSGKASAVTFDELAAACREQLPGVVLERRTKWLQYTFDLWSHAGRCLYSIPIASVSGPQPPAPRRWRWGSNRGTGLR